MIHKRLFLILLFIFLNLPKFRSLKKLAFRMPSAKLNISEQYLCTSLKIDVANAYYVVGFEPSATTMAAHHILLLGCLAPGSSKAVWNCGHIPHVDSIMNTTDPCKDKSEIIYGAPLDVPPLHLPYGVGFKVGKNTNIKSLVLKIHYKHVHELKDGNIDNSGVILVITNRPLSKLAGTYLIGTSGGIPPHSIEHMEAACTLYEKKTLHPFNYIVHTHSLGKVVTAYVIKNNVWIELGKMNPISQQYYNMNYNGTINEGDKVAARCTMKSERNKWTYIGSTEDDEMCNFYFMYYVENSEPLEKQYCSSLGPPKYYWHNDGLTNIPDKEASTL